MSNIILVNDNLNHFNEFIPVLNKNTYPITYNQSTDTYDSIFEKYQSMLNDPSNNIETINNVVLISYGNDISCETFTFLEKEETLLLSKYIHNEKETTNIDDGEIQEPSTNNSSLNNLQTWSSFKVFIQKFNIQKSLDFFGCVDFESSNWKYILSELGTEQHLNFNIRVITGDGSLKVARNLILESDNENIRELYTNI